MNAEKAQIPGSKSPQSSTPPKVRRVHSMERNRGIHHIGAKPQLPTMELYQFEGCPESHAVRRFLSEMGIDYVTHNVSDSNPLSHAILAKVGGTDRIPLIVDHKSGVKLYGANAIIAYLENEYGPREATELEHFATMIADRIRANRDRIQWVVGRPLEKITDNLATLQGAYELVRQSISDVLARDAESPIRKDE